MKEKIEKRIKKLYVKIERIRHASEALKGKNQESLMQLAQIQFVLSAEISALNNIMTGESSMSDVYIISDNGVVVNDDLLELLKNEKKKKDD